MSRRAALVTGASRGIGLAIARALAAEGYDLTISGRTADTLESAATALAATGVRVVPVRADMASDEDIAALAAGHTEAFARLDLLVLNAGMGHGSPIAETPLRRVDRHYAINLRSSFALIQAAIPLLRTSAAAHGQARVVALSSLAGIAAEAGLAAYSATKAGVISLCEALTLEESSRGILATAICPGYVDTDMSAWKHGAIDPQAMIAADDIAALVVMLTRLSSRAVVPSIAVTRPGDQLWRA